MESKILRGAYVKIAGRKHRLDKPTRKFSRSKKSRRKILEATVEMLFRAFIRNRDKKCCTPDIRIKCGGPIQCGHLISGAGKSVRWDERFAFGQCRNHNKLHEYRPEVMTIWFINKFGKKLYHEGEYVAWTTKKHTLAELEELAEKFK